MTPADPVKCIEAFWCARGQADLAQQWRHLCGCRTTGLMAGFPSHQGMHPAYFASSTESEGMWFAGASAQPSSESSGAQSDSDVAVQSWKCDAYSNSKSQVG